jgi:hypothetical protein
VRYASDKSNFESIDKYIAFARQYLDFATTGLQATIISQNEQHYRFWQYKDEGFFNITRPINSNLMYDAATSRVIADDFLRVLSAAHDLDETDTANRQVLCRSIYTMQQCIGAALDALAAGQSNTARKINGDLFERLIRMLIAHLGVDCTTGSISVPVVVDGEEQFRMSYQHDLIIKEDGEIKAIGGVKTSSKDRIDKIFMDKFLYSKLTETALPHIAIFLNDVQRKNTRIPNRYGINSTFLPGHFKGYTVKLNPLDGVYYCDIRPNMQTDTLLKEHIRTIDYFFCVDLWQFIEQQGETRATIEPTGNV